MRRQNAVRQRGGAAAAPFVSIVSEALHNKKPAAMGRRA